MLMWISVTKRQAYGLGVSSMGRGKRGDTTSSKDRSYEAMMNSPEDLARIIKWILYKGWFEQFRLAEQVEATVNEKMKRAGKG